MNTIKEHIACLLQLKNNPEVYNLSEDEIKNITEIAEQLEKYSNSRNIKSYSEFLQVITELAKVVYDIFGNSS